MERVKIQEFNTEKLRIRKKIKLVRTSHDAKLELRNKCYCIRVYTRRGVRTLIEPAELAKENIVIRPKWGQPSASSADSSLADSPESMQLSLVSRYATAHLVVYFCPAIKKILRSK